jgi:hypothetical protein
MKSFIAFRKEKFSFLLSIQKRKLFFIKCGGLRSFSFFSDERMMTKREARKSCMKMELKNKIQLRVLNFLRPSR